MESYGLEFNYQPLWNIIPATPSHVSLYHRTSYTSSLTVLLPFPSLSLSLPPLQTIIHPLYHHGLGNPPLQPLIFPIFLSSSLTYFVITASLIPASLLLNGTITASIFLNPPPTNHLCYSFNFLLCLTLYSSFSLLDITSISAFLISLPLQTSRFFHPLLYSVGSTHYSLYSKLSPPFF